MYGGVDQSDRIGIYSDAFVLIFWSHPRAPRVRIGCSRSLGVRPVIGFMNEASLLPRIEGDIV